MTFTTRPAAAQRRDQDAAGDIPAVRLPMPARPDLAPLGSAAFREALSHLAASVWVVTTGTGTGRLGRTVTSLMTLSVEPASLVVSIAAGSPLAEAIAREGGFALSLPARDQEAVADGFAGALPPEERFANARWSAWESGRPRLEGAVVDLDCALTGSVAAGTHMLFVGTVTAGRTGERSPLLWHRRGYRSLSPEESASS